MINNDEPPYGPSVGGFLADNGLLPHQVGVELKSLKQDLACLRKAVTRFLNAKNKLTGSETAAEWHEYENALEALTRHIETPNE